jgi:decaheme cytochrome c component MtrC/MtrF-like protein
MHDHRPHLLAIAVTLAAFGGLTNACGSGTPKPQPEPSPTASPEPGGEGEPAPQPTGQPTSEPGTEPGPKPAPPSSGFKGVPMGATDLLAEVEKIGINMKTPPEIGKIPLAQKKKMMMSFQKSLGFDNCGGCHAPGAKDGEFDFKKDTKNVQIARHMWNEYIVKLRGTDKKTIFCDSCHQGKQKLVPRENKDVAQAFMKAEYEAKLTRADAEEHNCQTCHGETFEMKIFEKLWSVK